jgi:hypothetical protein
MWAKFSVYGACPNTPEALTMWAKYAIYGAIDKIPEICRHMGLCGAKWITVEGNGVPNYMYI